MAIIGGGVGLRLLGLSKGIWLDEWYSLRAASATDLVAELSASNQVPLFYVILKGWLHLGTSEPFARLLSVLLGTAAVATVAAQLRAEGWLSSWLAALLCATLPSMLHYSQEIRCYSLLVPATAMSFWLAGCLAARPGAIRWYALLSAAVVALVCTHFVGIMMVPALLVFIALKVSTIRELRRGALAVATVIPGIAFAFLYAVFARPEMRGQAADWWMPVPSPSLVLSVAGKLLGAEALSWPITWVQLHLSSVAVTASALYACSLVVLGGLVLLGSWPQGGAYIAAAICYWCTLLVYSWAFTPIFWDRTAVCGLIPFVGFAAVQLGTIRWAHLRVLAAVGVVLLSAGLALHWARFGAWTPTEPTRAVAEAVRSQWRHGDRIVVYPEYAAGVVGYYLSEVQQRDLVSVATGADAATIDAVVAEAAQAHCRVFLIERASPTVDSDAQTHTRLLAALKGAFGEAASTQNWENFALYRYDAGDDELHLPALNQSLLRSASAS